MGQFLLFDARLVKQKPEKRQFQAQFLTTIRTRLKARIRHFADVRCSSCELLSLDALYSQDANGPVECTGWLLSVMERTSPFALGGLTLAHSNGKHVGLRDACFFFRGAPTADLADYLAKGRRVNA